MRIVSVSRRTDIPALYTSWFLNRIRAGYVQVRNPRNPRQLSTVSLLPHRVACLVFWTKDPRPMLPHLAELDARGFRYYFHVTLTGLPRLFEPGVPEAAESIAAIREISRRLGRNRVIWRFDPIILSDLTPDERIIETFAGLCGALRGHVGRVAVSFARYYRQVKVRVQQAAGGFEAEDLAGRKPEEVSERVGPLAEALARRAAQSEMAIYACAEKIDLSPFGVQPGCCIDGGLIREIFGLSLAGGKDRGQRPECGCHPSVDIGAYGTCRHGCLYCYAGADRALAQGLRHDPDHPLLLRELFGEESRQTPLF